MEGPIGAPPVGGGVVAPPPELDPLPQPVTVRAEKSTQKPVAAETAVMRCVKVEYSLDAPLAELSPTPQRPTRPLRESLTQTVTRTTTPIRPRRAPLLARNSSAANYN